MALDNARLPLTLPKSTKPPAAHILAFSPGIWLAYVVMTVGKCIYLRFAVCGRMIKVWPGL